MRVGWRELVVVDAFVFAVELWSLGSAQDVLLLFHVRFQIPLCGCQTALHLLGLMMLMIESRDNVNDVLTQPKR